MKKVTNPPSCEQSCCCHALGTRKKFGSKKNSNFLIEVNDKKNFLDPSGDNPGFSHIDVIFIRKVKARLFSQK